MTLPHGQGQHRARHQEGYDLNAVAGVRPRVLEPAMKVRRITVGQDYHNRPYHMHYFHVEEVLASMRTEATLRAQWIDRAEAKYADVERRLCRCKRPCEEACAKPSTANKPHGVAVDHNQRVYLHAMDCDVAIDAQRRMEQASHFQQNAKNGVCVLMSGEDKVRAGQHPNTLL